MICIKFAIEKVNSPSSKSLKEGDNCFLLQQRIFRQLNFYFEVVGRVAERQGQKQPANNNLEEILSRNYTYFKYLKIYRES